MWSTKFKLGFIFYIWYICLNMQGLRRIHRYPIVQGLLEYEEGWYEIFKEVERMRSIEDNAILAEDTMVDWEGWRGSEPKGFRASDGQKVGRKTIQGKL